MTDLPPSLPPCPITGRPAKRLVQNIPVKLLLALWRAGGAGNLSRLFVGIRTVQLLESDTGLYYFHPLIAGDAAFYQRFYTQHNAYELIGRHRDARAEYQRAALHVQRGDAVLDVGCGEGEFRAFVEHARYQGLDPYIGPQAPRSILRDTMEHHLLTMQGNYDVVTAFQVMEHVANPREYAAQLARFLRPGGLLILCVPLHPSPLTEIPNYLLNAPPHHLTWWNVPALQALADFLGLIPVEIGSIPYSPHEAINHWLLRLSLARSTTGLHERYFGHRWAWHLSLALGYLLARPAARWLPPPKTGRSSNVMLVARKPAV